MNAKVLKGYHSTHSKNIEPILQKGFKKSISEKDNLEWLGDGIYFWEDDYYAVQWNIISMEKNNEVNIDNYTILKAIIEVNKDKLFDISSPEGSIIFEKFKNKLIKKFIDIGRQDIAERLKNRSSKFWVNCLEDEGFFEHFDVVIAIYKNEKNTEVYKDDIVFNAQKQICVKNEKCIKNVEIYDNNERISNLYSIILKKREKNNE